MFISFFTGKVMLFYGITLIMKEKSNASALRPQIDNLFLSLFRQLASLVFPRLRWRIFSVISNT